MCVFFVCVCVCVWARTHTRMAKYHPPRIVLGIFRINFTAAKN